MQTRFINKNFLQIALVIILFSVTVADILSPEVCQEKFGGVPAADSCITASNTYSSKDTSPVITSDLAHDQHSPANPSHKEDDCICCCAHIIPSQIYKVTGLDRQSLDRQQSQLHLASSPQKSLFHPPRLA